MGKLKTDFCKTGFAHYLERARHFRPVECIEIRDADPSLPLAERLRDESRRILPRLDGAFAIALREDGQSLSSREFSTRLRQWDARGKICFVIGGPYGLDATVMARCAAQLSLSAMTWPHELARVLLLEQIYRAECIFRGFPYHHD